ncbi:hypothetical protein AAFX60_008210 [Aliivibrio fischeri]
MNSYRMGHLTKDGGVLEGRHFPVLFDTEEEFGEEDGTIRNLTIRYLDEVKKVIIMVAFIFSSYVFLLKIAVQQDDY